MLPDLLSRITVVRFTSVSSLLKDLNWAPLKDSRRDIRLAMIFKIVKCNMPVQADDILLPADPVEVYKMINGQSSIPAIKYIYIYIYGR